MTASEQVAPVVRHLRDEYVPNSMASIVADGIEAMAFEIDRLRARLRLIGIALTLLAISGAAVIFR